ncbi:MAG: Rossmann-like and DUF2520 domain-containing protein [bacterium]
MFSGKLSGSKSKISVLVVGCGNVGSALVWHLKRLGYRVISSSGRTVDFRPILTSVVKVIFLAVPDREIHRVFLKLRGRVKPGTLFVHLSGAFGVEVFKGAVERGLETLALHPVKSFFSVEQAIKDFPRGYFALDGSKKGLRFGRELVRALKGKAVIVGSKNRALYHAMCVFGSNFLHPLFDAVERIGLVVGLSARQAREVILPLTIVVLKNIEKHGAAATLTGPVKRGDRLTVRMHLKVLRERCPEVVSLYRVLTKYLERMK